MDLVNWAVVRLSEYTHMKAIYQLIFLTHYHPEYNRTHFNGYQAVWRNEA